MEYNLILFVRFIIDHDCSVNPHGKFIEKLSVSLVNLCFVEMNKVLRLIFTEHLPLFVNKNFGENENYVLDSFMRSMVVIDDLQVLCSTDEAEKIMELYRKHNADIYLEEEMSQQKNINELSGIEFERVNGRNS